jgi:hypothetical protein
MWLCGKRKLEEDLGDSMRFNKFVVWSWDGKSSLGEVCGVIVKRRE